MHFSVGTSLENSSGVYKNEVYVVVVDVVRELAGSEWDPGLLNDSKCSTDKPD
jgi:hypothetical protein